MNSLNAGMAHHPGIYGLFWSHSAARDFPHNSPRDAMTYMTCKMHRAALLVAAIGGSMPVRAATTDPSGFISHTIPAGTQRLIGVSLHDFKGFTSIVEGVSATGLTLKDTAERCGLSVRHVRKWAGRFRAQGLAGLHDQPRPGRTPVFSPRGGVAPGQDGLRAAR